MSTTTSATTFAATPVAGARGTFTQPGIDLQVAGVSAHQLNGSWRGIDESSCPSMSLHGAKQITPVAAGRSVRQVARVRAYAAAAQLKRQMINRNGMNGTKGSSPWRFPV